MIRSGEISTAKQHLSTAAIFSFWLIQYLATFSTSFGKFLMLLGKVSFALNDQILKNDIAIWSHWSCVLFVPERERKCFLVVSKWNHSPSPFAASAFSSEMQKRIFHFSQKLNFDRQYFYILATSKGALKSCHFDNKTFSLFSVDRIYLVC